MSGLQDEKPKPKEMDQGEDLALVHRRMDDMYRLQRHIYDLTRRYYLLGRDRLIEDLGAKPGEIVCEVGCGTGRNLVLLAKRYPQTRFLGLDASEEMLKSARAKLAGAGLADEVTLAHGFAERFDPQTSFGIDGPLDRPLARPLDRVVFSYSLSMIPPWREAIEHALGALKPGGEIHVVDFGDQAGLPRWFRAVLFKWLDLFGVHYRPELPAYLRELNDSGRAQVTFTQIARGYAFLARVQTSDK